MITIGTAIIYTLSAADAEAINRRRTNGGSIAERMRMSIPAVDHAKGDENLEGMVCGWPTGAQAHIGNDVAEGMRFPGVVVRDWQEEGTAAGVEAKPNLQVWLDGNDALWVTSAAQDNSKRPIPGTFTRA
jgi:hypothetical protein